MDFVYIIVTSIKEIHIVTSMKTIMWCISNVWIMSELVYILWLIVCIISVIHLSMIW